MGRSQHVSDIIRIYVIYEHIHIRCTNTSCQSGYASEAHLLTNSIRFKASGCSRYLVIVSKSDHIKIYIHSLRSLINNSYPADRNDFRTLIAGDCSDVGLVKRESSLLVTLP